MPQGSRSMPWSPPPQPLRQLERLLREPTHDLHWYHRLGESVIELVPADRGHKYGQGRIDALAEQVRGLLPNPFNILRRARLFAQTYRRSELGRLRGVPWSQAALLAGVPDEETRRRLERACKRHHLSYKALQERLRERYGKRSPGRSEPRAIHDAGPLSALRGISSATTEWQRSYEARLRSPKSPLRKIASKKPTAELQALLQTTLEQLKELGAAAAASEKTLEQLRRRVDRRLRAKAGRGQRATKQRAAKPHR